MDDDYEILETLPEADAYVWVEGTKLKIQYGDPSDLESLKTLTMEVGSGNDRDMANRLIKDGNFWVQFLGALSAAMTDNIEREVKHES